MTLPTPERLQTLIDRLNRGEADALNELIQVSQDRLLAMTRKIFQDYSRLRRWEESQDVLNGALVRLHKAIHVENPAQVKTAGDFFCLAAMQIRRELLDLVRHHFGTGAKGFAAHHHTDGGVQAPDQTPLPAVETAMDPKSAQRLSLWTDMQMQIEALPDEERRPIDLYYYQGYDENEIVAILNISKSTLRRRLRRARQKIGSNL